MTVNLDSLSPEAQANCRKLPELCYAYLAQHEPGNRIVIIKRGEPGYYATTLDSPELPLEHGMGMVKTLNARLKVTPAQASAMFNGSLFGFETPSADPDRRLNLIEQENAL